MMKISREKYLESAKDYLKNKDPQKALIELKKIDTTFLGPGEIAEYYLLFSEVNLWMGDSNIKEPINYIINYFRTSDNHFLYAKSKYLYGWYLITIGDYISAKEALLESYLTFKRYDYKPEMARVLNRLAFVHFQTASYDDSISNLDECAKINAELGNLSQVSLISLNRARVLIMAGLIIRAIEQLQNTEAESKLLKEIHKYNYFLTYGIALALGGNTKKAEKQLARTAMFGEDYIREKAIRYEYLGWIYNLDGKFKEAEKTLKTGIELSMKIAPESALISQTKRLLADAYIGLEKFDKAQKTAEDALIVAEKINERVEIAGCYRVFARVATHNREQENAREWYRKACEIFALIQSRYELAVTRYLMAISGLHDTGERSALLYMAREYFISEDVKPYTKKVNQAISKGAPQLAVRSTEERDKYPFIAVHPKTKKIVELAENIARADMSVLLTGPTGCGKDQLARYIHACSGRVGRFVTINSAAIPESMIESELFGYKKGAFTGADRDKTGLFELADNGTFYLNEIADSTLAFQVKLLEFIETKIVRRLGDGNSRKINVRIIAATNHDLEKQIRERKFRLDLYHRLNEIPIAIPPLSERKEDIPELTRHFLKLLGYKIDGGKYKKELKALSNILVKRNWPGNVRQLRGILLHLGFIAKGNLEKLTELIKNDSFENGTKREELLKALSETDWNQRETARLLNISEGTIRYRIKKYNLKKEDHIDTRA